MYEGTGTVSADITFAPAKCGQKGALVPRNEGTQASLENQRTDVSTLRSPKHEDIKEEEVEEEVE